MTLEENKVIVRRWVDQVFNAGNLEAVNECLDTSFTFHAPGVGCRGVDEFKQLCAKWLQAFPDMHMAIEDIVAEGDRVVLRWAFTGTHKGELKGVAATGRKVTFSGIWIARLEHGKVAETWEAWDALGLMQQLGVINLPK